MTRYTITIQWLTSAQKTLRTKWFAFEEGCLRVGHVADDGATFYFPLAGVRSVEIREISDNDNA